MSDQENEQEYGRGLFGYRRSVVNQMISDRDLMVRQAEGRVRAAESRAAKLEAELAATREQAERIGQLEQELERLRQEAGRAQELERELTTLREQASAGGATQADDTELRERAARADELERELGQLREQASRASELEGELARLREQASTDQGGAVSDPEQERVVQGLESELSRMRDENSRLNQQIEELRNEIRSRPAAMERAPESDSSTQITQRFLSEELSSILAAAEQTAARIIERARNSSEEQIAEADRMWRDAQQQIARFASWRDDVEPVIRTANSRIEDVRTKIEDVPEQIRAALAPLADAVLSLDRDLGQVLSAPNPPMLAPLGSEGRVNVWPDEGGEENGDTGSEP